MCLKTRFELREIVDGALAVGGGDNILGSCPLSLTTFLQAASTAEIESVKVPS